MNIEEFREYCLSLPQSSEKMPFNAFFHNANSILVFYVNGKIFSLFDINKFDSCTLKCNPSEIGELQIKYMAIKKPYNLSPKHWISVRFNDDVCDGELKKMVKKSYDLVSASL